MKQKKHLSTLAIAISLALTLSSCSDDKQDAKSAQTPMTVSTPSAQTGSNILSYIPADTPILMTFVNDKAHPIPENFKQKMGNIYEKVAELVKQTIKAELSKKSDEDSQKVQQNLDKWLSEDSIEKYGLSIDENEWAIYAINLSPVLRATLAKTHKMDEVLEELMGLANESKANSATKKTIAGKQVYSFGDKELQVLVSLQNNSLVASFAPSHKADALASQLLGFEKPKQNITSSKDYSSTMKKYDYLSTNLTWVNFRQIADYFVNPSKYNSPMIELMQIEDNKLSDVCKTEILGMVDKAPRLVGGTQLLEEHEMKTHLVWEMQQDIGTDLSKLSGRIPTANPNAKMSYGFSFDIGAAKNIAQKFVTNIQQSPFQCEFFANLNTQVANISQQLNQPLPPFVGNFKGMNIVLDELDLDFSQSEPENMVKSVKGNVLLAVDNPEALKGMAEMMMPDLQQLGLSSGGDAVNISSLVPIQGSMIPINLDHLFMAMGKETIGVSLGENTASGLKTSVSNESSNNLFSFKITSELYKNMFAGITEVTKMLPEKERAQLELQNSMMSDFLWWKAEEASLNFSPNGLEVFIDIDY